MTNQQLNDRNVINQIYLRDNAVVLGKIADGAVTTDNVVGSAITEVKIGDNSISAGKIQTNAITADKVLAGAITANKISVTELSAISANMGTLTAGLINGGTINATNASVINLNASNITTGTLSANYITGGTINANNIAVINLDANKITSGTINASSIAVINLNASNITAGTLSANRITGGTMSANYLSAGTINASSIDITNINANNINAGTITGLAINGNIITGGTVQTASSGRRVVMTTGSGQVEFFNTGGTSVGGIIGVGSDLQLVGSILISGGLQIIGNDFDMNGNSITEVNRISGDSGNIDFNESGRIQCSTHFDPDDAGNNNMGGATRYWGDISYKTLTDRGCLGWFDDGVELQDGRIVSDLEAIKNVKKHRTRKTVYGVPMLDYTSLPKSVYKKAVGHDGKEFEKDKNGRSFEITKDGRRLYAEDGAETTALISIMFGAIKELNRKIEVIESK